MKIRGVVVLESAAADIERGRDFYDAMGCAVGDYFAESILSDVMSLQIYAGIHPRRHGFMRMLSKRFPFAVYYEIDDDCSYVVAVLDMRMNPDTLRKSLLDRRKSRQMRSTP